MNNEKTIKHIVDHTLNWMNNQQIYKEDYKDIKGGCLHKIVERRITERFKYLFPHLNIYHPVDNSGLPDIYTDYYKRGIEVKCTFGWPEYRYTKNGRIKKSDDGIVRWTNGTIQISSEYFLFIKLSLKDNKLQADRIYFGKMSYRDWIEKNCNGSMYISENNVKYFCKQIK